MANRKCPIYLRIDNMDGFKICAFHLLRIRYFSYHKLIHILNELFLRSSWKVKIWLWIRVLRKKLLIPMNMTRGTSDVKTWKKTIRKWLDLLHSSKEKSVFTCCTSSIYSHQVRSSRLYAGIIEATWGQYHPVGGDAGWIVTLVSSRWEWSLKESLISSKFCISTLWNQSSCIKMMVFHSFI